MGSGPLSSGLDELLRSDDDQGWIGRATMIPV